MADLADVETALVGAINEAVSAAGLGSPSVTGRTVRVYRGWPGNTALSADLAVAVANVSVFAVPHDTKVTTRWGVQEWAFPVGATLGVAVQGQSAVFTGAAAAGQLAGLLVDGACYVHRTAPGDGPALVAATLGDAIRLDRACLVAGAVLTVPGAAQLVGRVTADAAAAAEWARQVQGFRLTVWAPDPASRDLLCGCISRALAQIAFLDLPDGSTGRLCYRRTGSFDGEQDARLYRRELIYDVEYGTIVAATAPSMLFGDVVINAGSVFG